MKAFDLNRAQYHKWDAFVQCSPQSTIYCKSWYLNALNLPYRIKVIIEKEKIIGGMVLTKNSIRLYSNPLLCKYLGVLFAEFEGTEYNIESKKRKICRLLVSEVENYQSYNYSFHPTFRNYLPFYWQNFSATVMYTYLIAYEGNNILTLQNNFHSKLRSELKYASNQNYKIIEDLSFGEFYHVICQTYLRQGGKPPYIKKKLLFFINELKRNKAISLQGIKYNNSVVAVAGLVYDENSTSLIFNGFDPNTIQRGANEMLILSSIQFGMKRSKFFDFEGSMLPNIDSFYRKFGGIHTPYMRIYKNNILNFAIQFIRKKYKKIKYGK